MRLITVLSHAARAFVIGAVRLYQRSVSRWLPPTCRFQPSCSAYMIEAVERHGVVRGVGMGLWRILRCNPFCRGGDDPVPPARDPHARADGPAHPKSPV